MWFWLGLAAFTLYLSYRGFCSELKVQSKRDEWLWKPQPAPPKQPVQRQRTWASHDEMMTELQRLKDYRPSEC